MKSLREAGLHGRATRPWARSASGYPPGSRVASVYPLGACVASVYTLAAKA
jgi:hypothetical protein